MRSSLYSNHGRLGIVLNNPGDVRLADAKACFQNIERRLQIR